MANEEHLAILRKGVDAWNEWRKANKDIRPDLTGAELWGVDLSPPDFSRPYQMDLASPATRELSREDLANAVNLSGANLDKVQLANANLFGADLSGADLSRANLYKTDLVWADLSGANLWLAIPMDANLNRANLAGANLERADLSGADLVSARLSRANLTNADLVLANLDRADLTGADLTGAFLGRAMLIDTTIEDASLSQAHVYGISAWNLSGTPADQTDLVITPSFEPAVTVDDIEVAQFIYLMLSNEKLKRVIDTITSKVVLILGRFTPDRKVVLDTLREELRNHNRTPVLFDFAGPDHLDFGETVTLLARMARYIIADLTDPASIPMELQAIAPDVAVPIRSIVHKGQGLFSMFQTLSKYHWVLPPYEYGDLDELLANLETEVIAPAEAKRKEL